MVEFARNYTSQSLVGHNYRQTKDHLHFYYKVTVASRRAL